jgi:hypothetical protein
MVFYDFGKILACITFFALCDLFRRTGADDISALCASFASEVNDMVRG